MKECTCKYHVGERLQPEDQFTCNPSKTYPLGMRNTCKTCVSFQRKLDREKHNDHIKAKLAEWRKENREYQQEYDRAYRSTPVGRQNRSKSYAKNRNQKRNYDKIRWRNDASVRARHATVCARRRAQLLKAIPPWYYDEELEIRQLYHECARISKESGIPHNVDHIVPIQNKTVCGLHCLANLRIIPAVENQSKGNRIDEDLIYNMWTNPAVNGKEPPCI